ncbi:MAG: 2-amino-4-hydroxy-6-hydroxymethyldihydropteridine diphosphokinase [Novosphingobium sp.]
MRGYLKHRYLIALGSNVRHRRHGPPRRVLGAALDELAAARKLKLRAASPIIESAPLGPSRRRYANAVALVRGKLEPTELLELLKDIEARFGRRRGARWSARVLDLDIVLWDGGCWWSPRLTIPHPRFRERSFVLGPAARIAPDWRDPLSGFTLRQLNARLTARRALPR